MTRSLLLLLLTVLAVFATGCKNRTNRTGDTLACAPGEALSIGCDGVVGSVCQGDPVMNACDGSIVPDACTDTNAFAHNDDSHASGASLCPQIDTTCPASGRITISTRPFGSSSFQCYWDIVHGGGSTDAGGRG
jgi:hypothetical protein